MTKEEKKRLKEERDRYESIISEAQPTIDAIKDSVDSINMSQIDILNIKKLQEETFKDAESIVKSYAKMFVSEREIKTSEFFKEKKKNDIVMLQNLLQQLEIGSFATKKIAEEISIGNLQPRMFEVLSKLQTSNLELIRSLAQYQNILLVSYQGLSETFKLIEESKQNYLQEKNIEEANYMIEDQITEDRGAIQTHRSLIEGLSNDKNN